jgi:hypothetical protein
MKQILALDLADAVCWAVRARDGGAVCATDAFRSGHTQSPGFQLLKVRDFVHELCCEAKVEVIAYRESASEMSQFWLSAVWECSERLGVPLQGVTAGAIKRHATGKGNASAGVVLVAIRDRGYAPASEGEAMAVALLLLAESGASLPSSGRMNGYRRRHEYEGIDESELDRLRQSYLEGY